MYALMKLNHYFPYLLITCIFLILVSYLLVIDPIIGISLGIGAIILPLIWIKPEIGFLLFVILLPVEGFLSIPSLPILTPAKIFLLLTIGALAARWVIAKERVPLKKIDIILPILFLWICLLSSTKAKDLSLAFNRIFVLTGLIIEYSLVVLIIRDRKLLSTVVTILLALGSFFSIIGLYQLIDPSFLVLNREHISSNRVISLMNDPNYFGNFLIVLIPLGICKLFSSSKWGERSVLLVQNMIMITCLIFTFSRGAMVALLVAIFFMVCKTSYKKRGLAFLISSIGYMAIMYIYFVSSLDPFHRLMTLDTSTYARVYFGKAAFAMMQDNPILGRGIGNFIVNCSNYIPLGAFYTMGVAHNMFLEVGAETGIIGFLIFLVIAGFALRNMLRALNSKDEKFHSIALGFASGFIGFLIHGLSVSFQFSKIFWFLLGISVVLRELAIPNKQSGPTSEEK